MNTNEKGNLGYAMTIADVTKKGYFIFMPFADTTNVDMVIANNKMELRRIQIKYRTKNKKGTIEIPSTTVVNGKKIQTDLNKIDIWAIYCPDTNKVYYISTEMIRGKQALSLRIDKPKLDNKNILYVDNFSELKF